MVEVENAFNDYPQIMFGLFRVSFIRLPSAVAPPLLLPLLLLICIGWMNGKEGLDDVVIAILVFGKQWWKCLEGNNYDDYNDNRYEDDDNNNSSNEQL